MAKQYKRVNATEARQAIYFGFEGDQAPVVVGISRSERVQQYVIDRTFTPAGPLYQDPRELMRAVADKAQRLDRRIISWSEDDLDIVRDITKDPRLVRDLEARYGNARALAVRWASRTDGTADPSAAKPASGELEHYLALVGFEVPEAARPGQVGKTLRSVRPSLEAGRTLTEHQAQRWNDLLLHNRYDCEGVRAVSVRAAADLERLERKTRAAKKGRKKRRPAKR